MPELSLLSFLHLPVFSSWAACSTASYTGTSSADTTLRAILNTSSPLDVRVSKVWLGFGVGALAGVGACLVALKLSRDGWPRCPNVALLPSLFTSSAPPLSIKDEQQRRHSSSILAAEDTASHRKEQGNSLSSAEPNRKIPPSYEAINPRADVPENAPESCPGVYSEQAGFSETCDGCPNQRLCASGDARKPDPTLAEALKQLNNIKHKVLVLSGKGGVGKSTVSSQLAWAIQNRGFEVGLLDVDICGPSIPRMTGMIGRDVHLSAEGWSPIYVQDNFAVMSIGFLLPDDDDAVIWRGPKKNALIRQFLTDVTWGELDFLIIDTPPGTSDEHLSIVTFLKETGIDGAMLVTTPQEVALQDVRKEINFCKKVNIPILGVIENMSGSIFLPTSGGAEHMANSMSVPFIGSIPMDPALLQATENGVYIESITKDSKASTELSKILDLMLTTLNEPFFPNEGEKKSLLTSVT
ncbi:putative cytosolic fe-s cluster assembling factor nbp35 [Cardiosporidium cionae]|uniref:Cytosolic Fe-S cluster assembly factor NUBP1 homolog n=1 Tax=Cardiosporidium cionae TaxID=476202 RepID=A0ABQ7J6H8_9APIC|nr:putative cytosolic fe-s cluster assembling factor nbp35 [Cardiosporidium cionae]|eukprot:KAF8819601.1 putative cytosolic fe-s cluster assembling factor nbp35 [Cardiosporidium cionae]